MDKKGFDDWLSKKRAPMPAPIQAMVLPITVDLRDYTATMQRMGLKATGSSMDEVGRITVFAE